MAELGWGCIVGQIWPGLSLDLCNKTVEGCPHLLNHDCRESNEESLSHMEQKLLFSVLFLVLLGTSFALLSWLTI